MTLTIVRNDPGVPPGALTRVASGLGIAMTQVALDAGDPLPDPGSVDAVVVLGGGMGAYDTHEYPYLVDEKAFLAAAVRRQVPVLGICLGCQLLADALGGSAHLADAPEVGLDPIAVDGDDPVVGVLAGEPTLLMHRDTWEPPQGALVVARSSRFPQAFRCGSALGIQSHPEVDGAILRRWVGEPDGATLVAAAGIDPAALVAEFAAIERRVAEVANRFFAAWFVEAGLIERRAS